VFLNEEGQEQLVDEGGEVYKPQGDYCASPSFFRSSQCVVQN